MGDDAPDAVRLVVDAQDADGNTGAAGRTAAFGMGTQAVDAAVQGYEYTAEIHQADSSHITVAHSIFLERLFVGVLTGLLPSAASNASKLISRN